MLFQNVGQGEETAQETGAPSQDGHIGTDEGGAQADVGVARVSEPTYYEKAAMFVESSDHVLMSSGRATATVTDDRYVMIEREDDKFCMEFMFASMRGAPMSVPITERQYQDLRWAMHRRRMVLNALRHKRRRCDYT